MFNKHVALPIVDSKSIKLDFDQDGNLIWRWGIPVELGELSLNHKMRTRAAIDIYRDKKPVAYFSAEFGIHESVPIYSGGLGVLSGDHIKSASGLGLPLVAVGLFYDQGYFRQQLDENGYQHEQYVDTKVENLPLEPARDANGNPLFEVDEDGNLILDDMDNPIPVMVTVSPAV